MSDKKLELSRRNMLAGLGTIGIASAGAGMGTSAYFSDNEYINKNTVTAGKLDLKLDWWQRYYQGKEKGWKPPKGKRKGSHGPMFEIKDAKPGDHGCGLICIQIKGNPAYVWAGCDLKERENSLTSPEKKVDDTPKKGELAESIKVALLRYPIVKKSNAQASGSDTSSYREGMMSSLEGDRTFGAADKIFVTTLKDLCEKKLHKGHLLDGKSKNKKKSKCFKGDTTYCYGFAWWIPYKKVGNEIQTDSLQFNLKFGAVQCRHTNPKGMNPFKKGNSAESSEEISAESSEETTAS